VEISVDLKGMFLATKTSLDGAEVAPCSPRPRAHGRSSDLGKTDSALSTYYRSLVFTGKGSMPKMCASDAEVIEYVSKTKGAIGYVSAAANAAGTKTLDVK
jgi:hypothetical protein